MHASEPLSFLRNVLYLDALTCFAFGALLSLGAAPLASAMQVPEALLFYAGVSLFPIAAFMAIVGKRAAATASMVGIVVAGNLLWVAASLWLLVSGSIAPNTLGTAFIALQAAAVAGLTALEVRGIFSVRRSPAVPMA
ncbi:MAG TPA: hypothetical protein VGD74_01070 [Vulgatibacter sp.]